MKNNNKTQELKTWKTIVIGDDKFDSTEAITEALISRKLIDKDGSNTYYYSGTSNLVKHEYQEDSVAFMQDKFFQLSERKEAVKLIKIKPIDMGFKNEAEVSFEEICNRAKEMGLGLCNQEVPLRLRLATRKEVQLNVGIIVATKPFSYANSLLTIGEWSDLVRSKRLLNYFLYSGSPEYLHSVHSIFVFRKMK